MTFRELFPVAT